MWSRQGGGTPPPYVDPRSHLHPGGGAEGHTAVLRQDEEVGGREAVRCEHQLVDEHEADAGDRVQQDRRDLLGTADPAHTIARNVYHRDTNFPNRPLLV